MPVYVEKRIHIGYYRDSVMTKLIEEECKSMFFPLFIRLAGLKLTRQLKFLPYKNTFEVLASF